MGLIVPTRGLTLLRKLTPTPCSLWEQSELTPQLSPLRLRDLDYVTGSLTISWMTWTWRWNSRQAQHHWVVTRPAQSFTTTFPVTFPQPIKGCGRQVTGPPHEIKILVTNSCLHSLSTGLLALSSFITLLSRHTPLSGICTYTLGQNTPNQANLIPKHPFSWPELESGQNEVQSVQFGPKLGKMFEKRAKLF